MQRRFARLLRPNRPFRHRPESRAKIEAMNTKTLAIGALAIAFALPLGASAQQYPEQQQQSQQQQQYPRQQRHERTMPNEGRLQQRWNRRIRGLNLSSDQQQRMQSLIHEYSQNHPQGSSPDRAAGRELHRQLMGMLSPDQRNQLRELRRQRRAHMMQQRGDMQQGGNRQQYGPEQQYPQNQQYPQAPPPDQQSGPPPA